MSHPVPGHDYSEQEKYESDKDYAKRRSQAIGKALKIKGKSTEHIIAVKHKGKITQRSWDRIRKPLKDFIKK